MRRRVLLAGAAAAWCATGVGRAATPTGRTIRILVGFPPGQATDMVARMMAEKLAAETGDNYIVENKPGQGGSLGLGYLAKAPKDGSVMMLAHMSAVATNPHMYKSVAYDSTKDFSAIGLVGDLPFVLVANPSMPFTNVAELIAYAKANPGKLTNASSGNGTVSHLAMEEFKRFAGVDIVHVPYQGSSRGLTDVMAGAVSIALETAAATKPLIEAGKLRFIGAGSAQRLDGVLSGPTLREQGVKDFTASTWLMLMYPAGVPQSMVDDSFAVLKKVADTPDFKQRLRAIGALPRFSASPAEAHAYVQSEYKYWGEVVKRSGVSLS